MSTLVRKDPVTESVPCPAQRDQANLALRCVLDAEIEALKDRLQQRSANDGIARESAPADRDRPVSWLQDSLAKLQARRDALC